MAVRLVGRTFSVLFPLLTLSTRLPRPVASLVVVVEGPADVIAVRAAAPTARVVHTNGKGLLDQRSNAAQAFKRRVCGAGGKVVVLTDPDLTGLLLRNHIDSLLDATCKHAFVPVVEATKGPYPPGSHRRKLAGDIGVEHATPASIMRAIVAARDSEPGRAAFSADDISTLGLSAAFDGAHGQEAAARRHRLCDALGIGRCNGKQLLRQLNRYCFTYDEVLRMLQELEQSPVKPSAWATREAPNPKVATSRAGHLPLQYAGPTPVQLLETFRASGEDGCYDDWDDWEEDVLVL